MLYSPQGEMIIKNWLSLNVLFEFVGMIFFRYYITRELYNNGSYFAQSGPVGNIVYPLSPQQKVSMMRNLEKMIHQALNDEKEVCVQCHI